MTKIKLILKRSTYLVAVIALTIVPLVQTTQASAAQITARKVVIDSSAPSASTKYTFTFTAPSATTVKSFDAQACDTASGTCTQAASAAGFSSAGAGTIGTAPTGLGSGGVWTSNVATTTKLRVLNASNTGAPSAGATITLDSVVNPSAANSTFFLRMTTYSDAAWTTPIDTGVVAASTAGVITVNATVDEALTFTLGAATVNLSPSSITTAAASTGTSTLVASTNAASGYSITYSSPNALKPAGGTALASYSSSPSVPGTAGFGINLKTNTTPAVGSNPTGGSGAAVGAYNTADQFTFVGSNVATQIATSGVATNATTYTVSYVANIAALTAPGAYTTTFTYVATPNF